MKEMADPKKTFDFVHLHTHTQYSLLDGAARLNKLLDRCRELGMGSIAITDHGCMYGVIDFYKQAVERGIKPIIGCEVYTAKRTIKDKEPGKDSEQGHLVLLAKNNNGYKNLTKIVSAGFIEGFYYKPRVDKEVLRTYSEGLIALSGCLAGDIPTALLNDEFDTAKKTAQEYMEIFGEGNFYLELMDHGLRQQQEVNEKLIHLGSRLDIPLVVTNDIHYVDKEDAQAHEILLCIQTGKTIEDEDRLRFEGNEYYLKSEDEITPMFSNIPEAVSNTQLIAQRCNVEFEFDKLHLPQFNVPPGYSGGAYLRELCFEGIKKRYDVVTEVIKSRLEYELGILEQMGFVDYFLIVWDFIRYARENGIMVGPGRGSAAGSIIAFALGITNIDPVKYGLLFERFLNPERISMPDIDIDFCYERRGEVIKYVVQKYGDHRVAQIITFGTMAARAVIRDVGRALNIPYNQVDVIAKQIPFDLGMNIDKALEINYQLKQKYDTEEQVTYLIDMARKLEGLPRHASTHAAGVVISKEPITEYVPLQKNEDSITTQFPMGVLEELGLLKMDFLGLRTLTVIRDAANIIKAVKGKHIDINSIRLDDPKVYKMISEGDTDGVFQLESSGMKQFMKELKPDNFEDIIAGISLYRPGPMDQIPRYIKNKNNPSNVKYAHDLLEPILNVTYGCIVYQEQVMQIVRDLAGYSLGRSDLVRRAMSKKKTNIMEMERKNFIYGSAGREEGSEIKGAVNNGIDENKAKQIFDEMTEFAKYAFNKSHAAAYAMIAYQTAWLKCHYPVEFMASLLTSVMDNTGKVSLYIQSCKKAGIDVLPPDVNESYAKFTVVGNSIRFGLTAVKNVGVNAIQTIIDSRKKGRFVSFIDFCEKVDMSCINKRTVESLIKCGAFDSLNVYRSRLSAVYDKVMDSIQKEKKNNISGQVSLFEDNEITGVQAVKKDTLPDMKEFPSRLLLSMEKEVTGIYISGHPLDEYKEHLEKICTVTSFDLRSFNEIAQSKGTEENNKKINDGSMVTVAGIIADKRTKTTKRNNIMAFVTLEDLYGAIDIVVFPAIYTRFMNMFEPDNLVIIKGRLDLKEEEEPKVLCESVRLLTDKRPEDKKLYIKVKSSEVSINTHIKPILKAYRGDIPVCIYISQNNQKLMANKNLWVCEDDRLINELKALLGEDCVKFA